MLFAAAVLPAGSAQDAAAPASAGILGFGTAAAARQLAVEARFTAIPTPESARDFHRVFTSEPHPAGSTRNNELAQYIADTWKDQGLEDIVIRRYDVLNSYPREIALDMVSPVRYVASLREDVYPEDPDTANPRIRGAYLGMSRSGEVTAPIVYARGGNPEDYAHLKMSGIDVRGKIVLVRYSNPYSYRGFKALTAQREGAAAILIYSDPAEDGFKRGKVYPNGPWGPESHIQRGAITYDFIVPGDPLTPGYASVETAVRVAGSEAQSLPKIMALALSWRDARPLLANMGGPLAPKDWQGGLPIRYRLGGVGRVHLKIDMDTNILPNYVVEARIRGSELPDDWVVFGNHRDAWEFGGVDPSSGTASMMELTRGLGALLRVGVRPRRTLVFCSWDGEEVGLTGSTEWGEQFADALREKMVAYLNVDSSTSGPRLDASSVPSLAPMLVEATRTLKDPSGSSLYDAWKKSAAARRGAKSIGDDELTDTRIGSGSDHTVFLNFLGRPTMLLGFDGDYGVYHSAYDNFYWMNRFGDPGYKYHTLMAQLWGVVGLRLANAELLPFDFALYAKHMRAFTNEVAAKPGAAAKVDFKPLLTALTAFETAGADANAYLAASLRAPLSDESKAALNKALMAVEGNWLNPDGIPGRPWFKHMVYAARFTYAHLELPGLTEAVEASNWPVAQQQANTLEAAVRRNAELLRGLRGSETGGR